MPEKTRLNSNLAVYGASGSMKTRSFCMNRILQGVSRGESLVICDPKSELYEKSSEYLRDKGYTVRVFNLVNPENSDSWKSRDKACGKRHGEGTGTWRTAENAIPSGIRTGKSCPCRIFRHTCRDRIHGQGFYHVLKRNCYGTARSGAVK